ncbi:unnamed protein product [Timema podura]|uniref:Sarcoplasmic calcium-binding proteins II, V, VI, and VII n=1 Tax=Timema podura TaxID=61482 RepID=A0ABN7NY13_TIMPD|nr:unnamed protein product [Timema podura]
MANCILIHSQDTPKQEVDILVLLNCQLNNSLIKVTLQELVKKDSLKSNKEAGTTPENSSGLENHHTIRFQGTPHTAPETSSGGESPNTVGSPRVPRKFIANWRHACDRTRDRTKELLKRWRTLPESEEGSFKDQDYDKDNQSHGGWSVHVWATWVRRTSSEEENSIIEPNCLSELQKGKLTHFFSRLLDWDQNELICEQDFKALTERLRHFADWSDNSAEFHVLREVQQGFVETFITNRQNLSTKDLPDMTTLEQWLLQWNHILASVKDMHDFPLWMQYFPKIIFLVINKSGSGVISRDELRVFYSSFLGFDTQRVGEVLDIAYNNMTSNGDHPLRYRIYYLCFANFLLGRHPHGPGQLLFGSFEGSPPYSTMFPVDYSALNCPTEKLEQYSPHKKSNRHSVIV